jgi:hypothetical protein
MWIRLCPGERLLFLVSKKRSMTTALRSAAFRPHDRAALRFTTLAVDWHQEGENGQSEAPKLLLRQPWWFGIGLVGTLAETHSFIHRRRKRGGATLLRDRDTN